VKGPFATDQGIGFLTQADADTLAGHDAYVHREGRREEFIARRGWHGG
jgi:hypothetical protein